MAERPRGYGMTAEILSKRDAKYDVEREKEARDWIENVICGPIETPDSAGMEAGAKRFGLELKDGTVLCQLINSIKPNTVKKINTSKMAFKQMENIGMFLDGCQSLGVAKTDLFQTVDLYEGQNMGAVVDGICALGRKAQAIGYDGPILGPRESDPNKRAFTDEQLKAGGNVIGLQMGSNKGATQAGMSYGNRRHILD